MEGAPANQPRHIDPKITTFCEMAAAETSLEKNCFLCSSNNTCAIEF